MTIYNNFTIVHQLKRRIRIIAPSLRKDAERGHILAILLNKREGIEQVKIVADIASVTICFDGDSLPVSNLLMLLDSVIENIGLKPRASLHAIRQKHRAPNQSLQDIVFGIGDMSCTSCALFLEMLLQKHPDVVTASVNYVSETARVTSYLSRKALFEIISDNGYQAFSIDSLAKRKLLFDLEQKHLHSSSFLLKGLGILSLPVALLGLFSKQSRNLLLLQALFATPVVFWGGRDIFKKALIQTKQGSANMDSLIALGVGASYAYSLPALFKPTRHAYFGAATAIIDFVMLGRYLEELAKSSVVEDIRKLVNLQPSQATLLRNKEEFIINADEIAIGDILLVRPGEKIPADGIVIEGLSNINEAMVTGSKTNCIKEKGHSVFDGSQNGSGVLKIRTTATGKDTLLANLIHMVDQAQASKLPIQNTVDQFSASFIPAIMVVSAATFGSWLLSGAKLAHALANSIAVLLISCPCALGLATPAATMVGTGRAARRGIYIRNGEVLESATNINTVVFDKTGTITEGNAGITDMFNISELKDEQLVQLAASVEFNSEHFLGQAIVRHAQRLNIELLKSSRFHSIPDQGVRAEVNGHKIMLGNQNWLKKQKVDIEALQASAKKLSSQGKTLIYVSIDKQAAGFFALTDPIRNNADQAIQVLHDRNIKTLMVTGDSETAAQFIAEQVGINTVISEADPQKKMAVISQLQQQGYKVAMVGDGINDAPALAIADLSLAIDKGTDIAIACSDLILLNGDISRVADSIRLSNETLGNIKQNLFWAFAYNAVAIPFAVAGKLTPTMASAAMAFSSVSMIANSLRLNK